MRGRNAMQTRMTSLCSARSSEPPRLPHSRRRLPTRAFPRRVANCRIHTFHRADGLQNPSQVSTSLQARTTRCSESRLRHPESGQWIPSEPQRPSCSQSGETMGSSPTRVPAVVIHGESLTIRPVVAKNPDVMTGGYSVMYAMRFEGDALVLTEVRDNKRPARYPSTFKLSRVE